MIFYTKLLLNYYCHFVVVVVLFLDEPHDAEIHFAENNLVIDN